MRFSEIFTVGKVEIGPSELSAFEGGEGVALMVANQKKSFKVGFFAQCGKLKERERRRVRYAHEEMHRCCYALE